jgi:hypothetical protein
MIVVGDVTARSFKDWPNADAILPSTTISRSCSSFGDTTRISNGRF